VRVPPTETPVAASSVESPSARRLSAPRWRDPRLLLGVVLVAVSVLVGARLVSRADAPTPVWSTTHALPVGWRLQRADLQLSDVRFSTSADAGRYLAAEDPLAGAVLTRALGSGELVPRGALASSRAGALVEVPLGLEQGAAPVDLAVGDRVDVWVVPPDPSFSQSATTGQGATAGGVSARAHTDAAKVLREVVVLSAGAGGSTFGGSATRTVVVGVSHAAARRLPTVLPALATGQVVLVRLGG
jgi:hypothetical protein